MNTVLRSALAIAGLALRRKQSPKSPSTSMTASRAASFSTAKQVAQLREVPDLNDRASSCSRDARERWEVCQDARFSGQCVVLRPGRYAVPLGDGPERSRLFGSHRQQQRAEATNTR
jgi:hypothetical protein